MHKFAAATAAGIVGLAFAMPASSEISMSGWFNQDIGFGSHTSGSAADSEGNVHMDSDAEINFTASGTTDGGVGVSVKIELEANPADTAEPNNFIDEGAISFDGGFGKVTLGNEDAAAVTHGYVGIGGGYGGMGYYDDPASYTPASIGGPAYGSSDAQRVIYSFPAMGGLSLAVSFAPDTNGRHKSTTGANGNGEVSVGASYSADLGGTTISIGGGMVSSTQTDDAVKNPPPVYCPAPTTPPNPAASACVGGPQPAGPDKKKGSSGVGVSVGFGDSTIHLRTDRDSEADSNSLGFGLDHTLGALGIGLGYGTTTDTNDDSNTLLAAGVSYDLGGGVGISASVARGTKENATTPVAPATKGDDVSAVGLGIRLGFSF